MRSLFGGNSPLPSAQGNASPARSMQSASSQAPGLFPYRRTGVRHGSDEQDTSSQDVFGRPVQYAKPQTPRRNRSPRDEEDQQSRERERQ